MSNQVANLFPKIEEEKKSLALLLVATVGFCLLLATKDFLYKYMAFQSLSTGQIIFLSGLSSTLITVLYTWITNGSIRVKSKKVQIYRLVFSGLSSLLIAEGFLRLSAPSVSMVSKVYIPGLLLVAPLVGIKYNLKQKLLAVLAVIGIFIFISLTRDTTEPLSGYGFVILAAMAVMVEYILLRRSTFSENLFWVAIVPSISCMLFGIIKMGPLEITKILELSPTLIELGLLSGIALFLIMFVSVYRYRILPLGMSEYPSLGTALLLVPFEFMVFNKNPHPQYLFCLIAMTIVMGLTIYFRNKTT